jgi:hypothetical protein
MRAATWESPEGKGTESVSGFGHGLPKTAIPYRVVRGK